MSANPPESPRKSWKAEVQTDSTGKWYGNDLRFVWKAEAEAYAIDLLNRWTQVREWRVVESDSPATHALTDEGAVRLGGAG